MTELPRSTPESEGMPSAAIASFVAALNAEIQSPHSYMLLRHGRVIGEGWWEPYGPRLPHQMFSVSKSFTSTAVGLAIAEGRFALDDTVVSLLPDDAPTRPGPNLAAMRVRHLLTMTTGHTQDAVGSIRNEGGGWTRAILALDVEHEPGSMFVYNSGASYLLSAIVQLATGQRLLDYLTPRLFAPLGITNPTWEQSPEGIDVGGWGLSITTGDLAVFGQLYLQRGEWNGAQLVPATWIDEATGFAVPNGRAGSDPDWAQGYGYQFWRCRHGAYRGDGAFGQFVVVLQDQDAVVVLTAGADGGRPLLDLIWKHLLPAFDSDGERMPVRTRLALPTQPGAPAGLEVDGVTARFSDQADADVRWARIEGSTLTIADAHGEHAVRFGFGEWVKGETSFGTGTGGETSVAASAAWTDDRTWVALLWLTETPFCYRIALAFSAQQVTLDLSINVSLRPRPPIHVTGRLERP